MKTSLSFSIFLLVAFMGKTTWMALLQAIITNNAEKVRDNTSCIHDIVYHHDQYGVLFSVHTHIKISHYIHNTGAT